MITAELFYEWGVQIVFGVAAAVFVILTLISAPYGRHSREGWGPTVSARLGWIVMEAPSPIFFLLAYLSGDHAVEALPLLFFGLFQAHYIHRALIFPLLARGTGKKRNALLVVSVALIFNSANGALCGLGISHFAGYDADWVRDPRFAIGIALFITGAFINLRSDAILRRLRGPNESGYKIPYGGLYRWVSAPNYLGEIVQWLGWAIATWTGAGFAFAAFTFANLVPRARANHAWYHEHFDDYPRERSALIPGLW